MDKVLYLGMTSAKQAMQSQLTIANNLANINTAGFKAQYDIAKAIPVISNALPTRTYGINTEQYFSEEQGKIIYSGNPMHLAIDKEGYFVVEANNLVKLTRNGSFIVDNERYLVTSDGHRVMGEQGPIQLSQGKVAIQNNGQVLVNGVLVDRLMLTHVDKSLLKKDNDGLFITNEALSQNENIKINVGYLEQSNVNPQEELVKMINMSRKFDLNLKVIETANENAKVAQKILSN